MRQVTAWLFLGAVGFLLVGAPPWLWYAVCAAAVFGLMLLIDAFLFDGDVYVSEWEPTVVSGLLQLAPWLVVPWFVDIRWTDASVLAVIAGVLNMSSLVFYFRAMRNEQDAVAIAVMWNTLIATVSLAAVFLLGEDISFVQKAGIGLILLGAMIGTWRPTAIRFAVVGLMSAAVVLSSLYAVSEKVAFNLLERSGMSDADAFWNVFLCFTLGEGLVALVAAVVIWRRREGRHLGSLVNRFWWVFLPIEGSYLAFTGLTARAYSLGPASLVAPIDGLAGPFVVVLSMLAAHLFRRTRYAMPTREVGAKQEEQFWWKAIGIAVIISGAFLVGGDG